MLLWIFYCDLKLATKIEKHNEKMQAKQNEKDEEIENDNI